jgi:hypothetical protein
VTRSRHVSLKAVSLAAVLVWVIVVGACSSSTSERGSGSTTTAAGKALPFVDSPSQAVLAAAAGLTFPDSVAGYRSVRVTTSELNVSFTVAAADLDAFVTGSHLGTLTPNKRIILHSSPVWDLNPTGTVQSAVSTRRGLERGVEVVTSDTDPTTDTIRLVVATP